MSSSLPQARIVRKGGVEVAPPRVPMRERLRDAEASLSPGARSFIAAIFGLWPVTAVVLLALGLCYLTSMSSAP